VTDKINRVSKAVNFREIDGKQVPAYGYPVHAYEDGITNFEKHGEYPKISEFSEPEIQGILVEASKIVAAIVEKHSNKTDGAYFRLLIIKIALEEVQGLSKSCNGIPGLRGLGLEEAFELSLRILRKGSEEVSGRDFDLNYRHVFEGISFNDYLV